jgi:dGTPase
VVDHLEREGRGLNLTWEVRDGILNHPWSMPMPSTPEAQVVRLADRIGYVNHDIDDAIRAGLLGEEDLPPGVQRVLGRTHGDRIETLVTDIVSATAEGPEVRMSEPVAEAVDVLRDFMFERVYLRREAAAEQEKAVALIRALFAHYLDHSEEVPPEYRSTPGDLPTRVADYIAGMTDRYALRMYERIFLPQGWLL